MNDIPVPASDFRLEEMDGELLLYHPASTKAVYLNETASMIWKLCDGERTIGEILELLRESFPEAGESMEADVESTLESFADQAAIAGYHFGFPNVGRMRKAGDGYAFEPFGL